MNVEKPDAGRRWAYLMYGLAAYACFLVTFSYAVGFVSNLVVPKSIDSGPVSPVGEAAIINCLLLGLFAVQHAVMARPWFKKRVWHRFGTCVSPVENRCHTPIERSTFVLATCIVLGLMYWQWRPMPDVVWSVTHPLGRTVIHGLFVLGWAVVLYASFCIDHFDLFGLRHVVLFFRGKPYTHPGLATPWLYRMVRNPLMLGFIIAFWATPVMTQGHLLFSLLTTAYVFVGIQMEERDLLATLGEGYRQYHERTPMILPLPRRRPLPVAEPCPAEERPRP